jgi:hypothetical protein
MGYVGNHTTNSFTSMEKQDITGDGTPNYTLSHAVANANEIEVFVNNVRQEPSVAYNASGTTLTMTGNVASTDDFYVVYQGKAVQTTTPPDDSVGTAKILDNAVTSAKIADDAVTSAKIATLDSISFGTSKWIIELDSVDNDLNFKYNGTTVFKLASNGAVTSADNVTAFGSP